MFFVSLFCIEQAVMSVNIIPFCRFCVISPPQLDLLANSLEVVVCFAKHSPAEVSPMNGLNFFVSARLLVLMPDVGAPEAKNSSSQVE